MWTYPVLHTHHASPCALTGYQASPAYFASPTAARLIASHLASANAELKLLFFSRDPITRFISRLVGNRVIEHHLTCSAFVRQCRNQAAACVASEPGVAGVGKHCCLTATNPGSGTLYESSGTHSWALDDPLSHGAYVDVLEALWRPNFPLGSKLLVMPSEMFLPRPAGNVPASTANLAYQRIAAFLGLSQWTDASLAARPSLMSHVGTHHADTYEQAVAHNAKWVCSDSDVRWLSETYAQGNAALATLFAESDKLLVKAHPELPQVAWPLPGYLRGELHQNTSTIVRELRTSNFPSEADDE